MPTEKYSNRSIWIHWLSAFVLLATIPTGLAMSETEASTTRLLLYKIHFVIGTLVFVLALFHVYIYFKDQRPQPIDTGNKFQNKFVRILHRVLTILILILTFTGVVSLFTTQIWEAILVDDYTKLTVAYDSIFVTMHHIQGLIFIVLIILHIGGVLLHRIKNGKSILKRMGIDFI